MQPQFFPWIGYFEQVHRSDIFVHLDDVQLPQGRSFCSRVQIKTPDGIQWLSVPVQRAQGQRIVDAQTTGTDWQERHLKTLHHAFARYPHRDAAIELMRSVYRDAGANLRRIDCLGAEQIAAFAGLKRTFLRSSELTTSGAKDDMLLSILRQLGADTYVTGLGALNYLDHERFEREGIAVEYMDYRKPSYEQQHGAFTPFVTALDAIAATGPSFGALIASRTRPWREMLQKAAS